MILGGAWFLGAPLAVLVIIMVRTVCVCVCVCTRATKVDCVGYV